MLLKNTAHHDSQEEWRAVETWWQSTYDRVIHWDTNLWYSFYWAFPGGSDDKESACNAGDLDLIPGSGRVPGGGHGSPLQYFCLENFMDRGPWGAIQSMGVTKSWTWLSDWHFHFFLQCHTVASWPFWNGQLETSRDFLLTYVTSNWSPHEMVRPGLSWGMGTRDAYTG